MNNAMQCNTTVWGSNDNDGWNLKHVRQAAIVDFQIQLKMNCSRKARLWLLNYLKVNIGPVISIIKCTHFNISPPEQRDQEAHVRQHVYCSDLVPIRRKYLGRDLPVPRCSTASTSASTSAIEKGLLMRLCPISDRFDLQRGTMARASKFGEATGTMAWELADVSCAGISTREWTEQGSLRRRFGEACISRWLSSPTLMSGKGSSHFILEVMKY